MSGHSKWKNIMHKKQKSDSQRGSLFTKIGREIAVAVREGGGDPESNYRLRDIIAKAKENNVPNENLERSIKKAMSVGDSENYENIVYEGYGPNGTAVIVECLTDNRNRTAGDLRHYFDKFGGNLGQSGSVAWQFTKKGILIVDAKDKDEETVMLEALEVGADDVSLEDDVYEISTPVEIFESVRDNLQTLGYKFLSAQIMSIPANYVSLSDEDDIKNMTKLLEQLEDNDDVQEVWHNWDN